MQIYLPSVHLFTISKAELEINLLLRNCKALNSLSTGFALNFEMRMILIKTKHLLFSKYPSFRLVTQILTESRYFSCEIFHFGKFLQVFRRELDGALSPSIFCCWKIFQLWRIDKASFETVKYHEP